MTDHQAPIDEWNHAATSGTLKKYKGDPPPRIHSTTVGWMAKSMDNDREAKRVVFPAVGMFLIFATMLIVILAAMGAW